MTAVLSDSAAPKRRFVDIRLGRPDHSGVHSRVRTLLVVGMMVGGVSFQARADAPVDKAAAAPKFRVEAMGPPTLTTEFAGRLANAAATGLAAAGAEVLPSAGAGPEACVGAACVQPAAPGTVSADYLLRGTCTVEGSTYRLHLELVDARTNAVTVGRDDLCEICTETEVADATNVAASALKVAFDRSLPAAAPVASVAPPKRAAVVSPEPRRAPWRRALPWVAFGASAAALGTGVYFLAINGKSTDYAANQMGDTRLLETTWRYAVPSLGIGVAAAVVGFLTLPRASSSAAESWSAHAAPPPASAAPKTSSVVAPLRVRGLALSPGGLAAWGTF